VSLRFTPLTADPTQDTKEEGTIKKIMVTTTEEEAVLDFSSRAYSSS
jgi:hypothetical protein